MQNQMKNSKKDRKLIGVALLSAIAASSCCITPILAIISGTSGLTSAFQWMAPLRLPLVGLSVALLGFSWFQKFRAIKIDNCNCEVLERNSFLHSKLFLAIITAASAFFILFPYYSNSIFQKVNKPAFEINKSSHQLAEFKIRGMSCASCEDEVKSAVNKLPGIIQIEVHFGKGNAFVSFDSSKINSNSIAAAINQTGYRVYSSLLK
jgi:mercuric ion transport protein